jgi:hypothetical protein
MAGTTLRDLPRRGREFYLCTHWSLAGTVDAVVLGVDPGDLGFEGLVTHLAAARLPADVVVTGRWGDQHTQLGQL